MKFDLPKVLLTIACATIWLLLATGQAHGAQVSLKNAWDNSHVWARVEGVNPPYSAVWETRDLAGRLMERQTGITTQLTLDDEWRIISLVATYGDERFAIVSIKARFYKNVPIFVTLTGTEK